MSQFKRYGVGSPASARPARDHRLALVGDPIDAAHAAVLRLGVDDARVVRIHQRLEAVAAADLTYQSSLMMPLLVRTALGPHHVLLSCRPAQT